MAEPSDNSKRNVPAPPPAPRIPVAPVTAQTQTVGNEAKPAAAAAAAAADAGNDAAKVAAARRRRVSVSTIIAIVAVLAVVLGAYFGWQALNSANEKPTDTRLADTTQTTSGASGSGQDSSESSAEVSAAEQAVQAQLDALEGDENGAFRAVVDKFVSAYDAGVSQGSYSLSDLGITGEDLAPLLRSGFECEVSKADVYDGTAWVTVSITSKNISDAADTFVNSVVGMASKYSDEASYKAALKDAFVAAVEKQQVRTISVLLTVPGAHDTWTLDDANVESLLGTAWYS